MNQKWVLTWADASHCSDQNLVRSHQFVGILWVEFMRGHRCPVEDLARRDGGRHDVLPTSIGHVRSDPHDCWYLRPDPHLHRWYGAHPWRCGV
jgi:hypothetical protein